jgi:hypothetical protein
MAVDLGMNKCVNPVARLIESGKSPIAILLKAIAFVWLLTLYSLGFFVAFCVALTMRFTAKPEVTWDWMYWFAAFTFCAGINRLFCNLWSMREFTENEAFELQVYAPEVVRHAQKQIGVAAQFANVLFIVFVFKPHLALWLYGWPLNLIGFGKYLN